MQAIDLHLGKSPNKLLGKQDEGGVWVAGWRKGAEMGVQKKKLGAVLKAHK